MSDVQEDITDANTSANAPRNRTRNPAGDHSQLGKSVKTLIDNEGLLTLVGAGRVRPTYPQSSAAILATAAHPYVGREAAGPNRRYRRQLTVDSIEKQLLCRAGGARTRDQWIMSPRL